MFAWPHDLRRYSLRCDRVRYSLLRGFYDLLLTTPPAIHQSTGTLGTMASSAVFILALASSSSMAAAQYGLSSLLAEIGYTSAIINPTALPSQYASSGSFAPSATFAPTAVSASSAYPLSSGVAYPTDSPDIVYDAPSPGSPCGRIQSVVDQWSQDSNQQGKWIF